MNNCKIGHKRNKKFEKKRGDYLLVGVHGDTTVNRIQGMNLPLMNLHERVLSVLGCRYVNDVLIDAPLCITPEMITSLNISEVIRGVCVPDNITTGSATSTKNENDNTSSASSSNKIQSYDYINNDDEDIRYRYVKQLGIYTTIPFPTPFRITSVIQRIQKNQEVFQTKFERKMESERQYYMNRTQEKKTNCNNSNDQS
jgi:ethanolamine-phosphate cytidylyltransferase